MAEHEFPGLVAKHPADIDLMALAEGTANLEDHRYTLLHVSHCPSCWLKFQRLTNAAEERDNDGIEDS